MSDNDGFTLSIDFEGAELAGEEAEMYGTHRLVAQHLERVAERLREGDYHPGHTSSILDVNGNRVGSWRMPPE